MLLLAGSFTIAILGASASWLTSRKIAWGWLVNLAAQLIGLHYDAVTHQLGFIPITLLAIPAS